MRKDEKLGFTRVKLRLWSKVIFELSRVIVMQAQVEIIFSLVGHKERGSDRPMITFSAHTPAPLPTPKSIGHVLCNASQAIMLP